MDIDPNETMRLLSETMAVASFNPLTNLEFKGGPGEDIHDFLRKLKMSTLGFSDKNRCIVLNKALKGTANVWARANVKALFEEADFANIKKALVERFGPPDYKLRHLEKLAKMKYNDSTETLYGYVENYFATYKKAYPKLSEQEAIQSIRLNLPDTINQKLNYLNDLWSEFTTKKAMLELIRRLETKILPFEKNNEHQSNQITKEYLGEMLEKYRQSVANDISQHIQAKESKPEALALMEHKTPSKPIKQENYQHKKQYPNDRKYQRHDRYDRAKRPSNFDGKGSNYKQPRLLSPKREHNSQQQPSTSKQAAQSDALTNYYNRFGEPPGPCFHCEGRHFNRHCPLLSKDLN